MWTQADLPYQQLIAACLRGDRILTRNSLCRRYVAPHFTFTATPLVSVRKTAWKYALREMEWFLSGSNNINDLHPSVHHWWKPWADASGVVANNYGRQLRAFYGVPDYPAADDLTGIAYVDQIEYAIHTLRHHPNSRRNVFTCWNTAEMVHSSTALTNCHNTLTQLFVESERVRMVTYQRSADVICGLPANWVQQWALLKWLAHRSGREVGALTWVGGDCHVYDAHTELAQKIVKVPTPLSTPELVYAPTSESFRADDFTLSGDYSPVLSDRAEMIV